jgi:hypothetical protein
MLSASANFVPSATMPLTLKADERFTAIVFVSTGVVMTVCVMLWDRPFAAALMVTVPVPGAAELAAVSVIVLPPVVVTGSKTAVTPGGRPVACSVTLPLKLPRGMVKMVAVALLPCGMEMDGAEEIIKSGAPALGDGKTSYSGCAGLTTGFSSATEMARMRMSLLSGSCSVLDPAGRSIAYPNR